MIVAIGLNRRLRGSNMHDINSNQDIPRVISPENVAKLLGKSRSWVYAHAAELGASRIGSTWIFTKEGLTEALQKARREDSPNQNYKKNRLKALPTRSTSKGKETVKESLIRHGLIKN